MTELQMGLIALGGTAVVGVFAYNKWQEYRHRKLAEAVLKPQHEDVLLGGGKKAPSPAPLAERHEPDIGELDAAPAGERLEPVFGEAQFAEPEDDFDRADFEEPAAPVDSPFAADQIAEPVAKPAPVAAVEEFSEFEAGPVPAELLDPRLELVVAMDLVESVSVQQILRSQRDTLQRLSKPVHWVGFNERSREWVRLGPESELRVRRLRIGLQLVNRLGPVAEGDVVMFSHAMEALADELMAVADMPSGRVLDQAAELDRFCAAVDLEIGINLVSRGSAFSGTKIRALAEAAGMVLGIDGLFTR